MTVSGGKSIRRSIRKLKRDLDREVNDAVERGLDGTERGAKRRLVEKDAVATTEVFNSFVQNITHEVVDSTATQRHTLKNVSPHASFLEFGTGTNFAEGAMWGFNVPTNPYAAPSFSSRLIGAIATWIRVKPGFRGARNMRPDEEDAVWIAWSIAYPTRKDPETGTPPQPFMRPAWFVGKNKTRTDAMLAVKKAVGRV